MDSSIVILLAQDGITNGAIYALLALALVMVFAVTRVIFIPLGQYVAYGALTLAALQGGKYPGTIWLLLLLGSIALLMDGWSAVREGRFADLGRSALGNLGVPALLAVLLTFFNPQNLPLPLQVILALMLVVPLGPLIYRVIFQPLAEATILTLLIVSVAIDFAMLGLGLLFFGPEAFRTPAFSDGSWTIGEVVISAQTLWVIGSSALSMGGLYYFFERTVYGKALRATALNRIGARLMGIPTELAGRLTFFVSAFVSTFAGILLAPITPISYDTGLLIGLKGFVAGILGGLGSYPLAAVGAIFVGLLEAFSSFWASDYKEVIVFTIIIPVLLWRSLFTHHVEEEE
ncbi:MAG: branched-chain amino acid ABC transporter permease [Zoogloea sp.]|uniref:branched-chain amino acid ABC transporter permease n=1 Tax=Zoogloea sp. TaxID=49181 RepID=UPI003F2AD74A